MIPARPNPTALYHSIRRDGKTLDQIEAVKNGVRAAMKAARDHAERIGSAKKETRDFVAMVLEDCLDDLFGSFTAQLTEEVEADARMLAGVGGAR